jgi:dihydrofolate reductase
VIQAATFQEALAAAEMMQADSRIGEVFVIGGAQVFGEAIQSRFCRKIFMTHILKDFHCDVFFPAPMENYRQIHASVPVVENGVSYFFAEYLRG